MPRSASYGWRMLLAACGAFIFIGGPMHPGGTMAEMLANPIWFAGHALVFLGFAAYVGALMLYRREPAAAAVGPWLRLALVGAVLQTIEMAAHTMAYVDAANLVAGRPTPVLTTHLWMTVVFYPTFAVTTAGFLVAATHARSLGSPWVNWIGVVGVVCHGLAGLLVPIFDFEWARALFPMIVLFALWALLAAVWPKRAEVASAAVA